MRKYNPKRSFRKNRKFKNLFWKKMMNYYFWWRMFTASKRFTTFFERIKK
jgi:hypothetical protein